MTKKKRTKNKKKSSSQTKARRTEKTQAKKAEETKVKSTAEAVKAEETTTEDTETAGAAEAETPAKEADSTEKKTPKKKEAKKKEAKKKEVREATVLLKSAREHFQAGHYRLARQQLLKMLDSNPSPEEREQAQELLGNMEMDVRTLMVGAVAMVTLLLIPTLGYHQFAKALWTLPVLFLLLIVDPRLFRSPGGSEEN